MKNYYELTKKERIKYILEFNNETVFGRKINTIRVYLFVAFVIGLPLFDVISFVVEEKKLNVGPLTTILEIILFILLMLFIIYSIILVIARMRYMKIKHKIEF